MLEPLLKEIRKIDDKLMLVELQLVEAKIYHSLENFSKAKVLSIRIPIQYNF